jgi:dihydrodipicolinate synthase/N-acetylneuraminate lyase
MNTETTTPERLSASVIAVPPLARDAAGSVDREQNCRMIRHLEAGGVTTLLYGGNAVFYHVSLGEYESILGMLADTASGQTIVIPSVGPSFGFMMDQASILRRLPFPTAMILPQRDIATPAGVATGVRRFAERFGRPVVLYLKHDGMLDVPDIERLMDDGLISWIKYAVVRPDAAADSFLRRLVDTLGGERVVSGMGEQPAIVHMRDFGLAGFTSGCVCVAPTLSMRMLRAVRSGRFEQAEAIRAACRPLEDLRDRIHPIRVLHEAVALAGIAATGPLLPLLSKVGRDERPAIQRAAQCLLELEMRARGN